MLDRKSYLADAREGFTASTITFSRWADVGAEALVKVQLSVDGRDLRGEMRLFTVSSGKEELRLVHVAPLDQPRKLAHFFADALYKQFTREPGPFQSHLAFVRRAGKGKDVYLGDWDGKRARTHRPGEHQPPARWSARRATRWPSPATGRASRRSTSSGRAARRSRW